MFQKFRNKATSLVVLGTTALVAAGNAAAAPVDVTAVTAAIADTLVPIGAIGAGVLLVIVGIKTYKWVRRAM